MCVWWVVIHGWRDGQGDWDMTKTKREYSEMQCVKWRDEGGTIFKGCLKYGD